MKIAVIISGWHFPLHFFKTIAQQKIPAGWTVDLFCVSHRDPKYSAEEKIDYLSKLGWSYAETLDHVLYEKIASVAEIEKLGWKYMLCPNTVGDWGNTNQWLEKYDYKKYDMLLVSHDDNLILNNRLYIDLLTKNSDWLILTNSKGSHPTLNERIKKLLGRTLNVRGSFEFIKPETLDILGGKFDLSPITLTREGENYSGETMKTLNNWNMTVVPLRKLFDERRLGSKIVAISPHYRVSEYCIEGERGLISSIQPADKKSIEKGLAHIQGIYNERLSNKQ